MPQPVKGARLDEAFHGPLVERLAADPLHKIKEVGKRPVAPLLLHEFHGPVAHVFHAAKTEADAGHAALVPVHAETPDALVDVGLEHRDTVLPAVLDITGHLGRVVHHGVEGCGHEGHGMIALEPAGLHGHHGVGRGMAFVEGVAGEGAHLVEDLLCHRTGHTAAHRPVDDYVARLVRHAVDEVFALLGHHVALFLGHGAAHQVAAAQAVSRQVAHDLHHLLLIHHAAVGDLQNGPEKRRFIMDRGGVVLAGDVAGDGVHGSRAVEGDGGDHVLEAGGLHVLQKKPHAAGFELEHAVGVALGNHAVDLGIVQRNVLRLHLHALPAHHVQGIADDRQRPQAQEVHL